LRALFVTAETVVEVLILFSRFRFVDDCGCCGAGDSDSMTITSAGRPFL
jgi:hypothetical protein